MKYRHRYDPLRVLTVTVMSGFLVTLVAQYKFSDQETTVVNLPLNNKTVAWTPSRP